MTNGGNAQYTVYLVDPAGKFAALTAPLAGPEIDELALELGVTLDQDAPPAPAQSLVLHRDQVGSTQAVTDDSGLSYATVTYGAWGQPTIEPPENDAFRPLFGGNEYTSQTGLYYANARYLDAFSGRFASADTQVAAGALVPDSFNDYAYALNNPVLYADPSGHFPKAKVTLGVLAGVTAVALAAAGLDVLAAEDIDLVVDLEEDDLDIDMVMREPTMVDKPQMDEGTPLLRNGPVDDPADTVHPEDKSRSGKLKKHASNFAETMVQAEVVHTGKYYGDHHGSWSWKGYGYGSAIAALGGVAGFGAGTIADSIAGTQATTDGHVIKTLIRGPIQGAAITDMGRALDTTFTDQSSDHGWAITTARGAGTGLTFSMGVFGLKTALRD